MTTPTSTSIPYNGSGTVNIHINNPSANLGGGMPAPYMPMPYMPYMPYAYPPNYYLAYPPQGVTQITNVNTNPQKANTTTNSNGTQKAHNADATAKASATATTNTPDKKKEREIVILTDNYIKNLENYLRNPNAELRKNAIKEILMRFKEDKSRLENPSLTALLNLALQDPNSSVKAVAMSIIGAGYAKGNAQTEEILKNIQSSKTAYSQDATQAADSLLQMSKTKTKVTDNSHYQDQQTTKKGK